MAGAAVHNLYMYSWKIKKKSSNARSKKARGKVLEAKIRSRYREYQKVRQMKALRMKIGGSRGRQWVV